MTRIERPILRYHGGKWKMAPWIIQFFPTHRVYVEPFAGGASVLLRKPQSKSEILNDVNSRLVNLFQVLRNPQMAAELEQQLRLTPFARAEQRQAIEHGPDPVEDARRLIVLSYQSYSGRDCAGGRLSGFRDSLRTDGTSAAQDWGTLWEHVQSWAIRLRGVTITSDDYWDVMKRFDYGDTLFYCDPPYVRDSRGDATQAYGAEFTDGDHEHFLKRVKGLCGMVILSGYECPLYEEELSGWERQERDAKTLRNRKAKEVIWLNERCVQARKAAEYFFEGATA
jgi:DNA adenine methylase